MFSDYVTSTGIRIIALILASKSDHSAYGSGIRWPIFTVPEIAEKLHTSESTIERTTAQLQKLDLLKKIKTKDGVRYEVLERIFEDDTYRGKPHISFKAKSQIEMPVIACEISDEAFHLLYMLEATAKGRYDAVKVPQSKLRTYFKSPRPGKNAEDPYISLRQLNTWLRELEGIGLLERHRPGQMEQNEYILNQEIHRVNGVEVRGMVRLPDQLASAGQAELDEAAEELQDEGIVTGKTLAEEFRQSMKEYRNDRDWALALSREGAFNTPALGSTINRWLSNGVEASVIRRMIDLYPIFSNLGRDQENLPEGLREAMSHTVIWRDFVGLRFLLHEKADGQKAQAIMPNLDDSPSEGYEDFYENNVFLPAPKVAKADDDPWSPANRLAMYRSRMAS
ncbi:hypothetical protein [Nonomuraea sp. NEAU-A123]|uniref:hypothetical protein n=1 Tax=Nonomuraea sp. NEAU-A123 TaxID=2839649 RepID=UPI001BE4DDD3|nr:hypothetical protein [Nonomuraea sp. NEAU-A123]MBT2232190.1 hypothetical protein [Nonomuraea sp. NEAU-A123]